MRCLANRKLSPEQEARVVTLHTRDGLDIQALCERFGVHRSLIRTILQEARANAPHQAPRSVQKVDPLVSGSMIRMKGRFGYLDLGRRNP